MKQAVTDSAAVSKSEFARLRGVSPARVTQWGHAGWLVLTADGKVDVAASNARLATRPPTYRGGKVKPAPGAPAAVQNGAGSEEAAPTDPNAMWTLAESQRVRENFLAMLRRLQWERESGLVAPVDEVAAAVAAEYAIVRRRLRAIGKRVAPALIGCGSAAEIQAKLEEEIYAALEELSRGAGDA